MDALEKQIAALKAELSEKVDAVKSELSDKVDTVDTRYATSAREQGKRIGDSESEIVAMKAVEEERRRVREDTRGIPVTEGKRSRGER
jgi:hypothetical protein